MPGNGSGRVIAVMGMREVGRSEYLEFLRRHDEVVVDGKPVRLVKGWRPKQLEPPDFRPERTTVWSFENRGRWATHRGDYRANWAPEIPRNLILRYTSPGDLVLDPMVGSGTTLVECKLLGRNGIGVDINRDVLMLAWNRLDFPYNGPHASWQKLYHGDARNLNLIDEGSVDLLATHPPYMNIVKFSRGKRLEGDLSRSSSVDEFIENLRQVARESFRVLKPGGHCAILIGDTHKHKHYVPISFRTLEVFLDVGFILREQVIKLQWHTETMRGIWRKSREHGFLLVFHEHLFIFRKPEKGEDTSRFWQSMKWW